MKHTALATIRDAMSAKMERDALELRNINAALTTLETEISALSAPVPSDGTVSTGIFSERYQAYRRDRINQTEAKIKAVRQERDEAEESVTKAFAETRAVERLLDRQRQTTKSKARS